MDILSPSERSKRMAAVRQKDTALELQVRKELHALGFRFRLHARELAGTPDILLPRWRKAVFVHGCFWHGHNCRLGQQPATSIDYWAEKIRKNRERDTRVACELTVAGWGLITVWNCAMRGISRLPLADFREVLRQSVFSPVAMLEITGRASRVAAEESAFSKAR